MTFTRHDGAVWEAQRREGWGSSSTSWHAFCRPRPDVGEQINLRHAASVWEGTPEHARAGPHRLAPPQRVRLSTHAPVWEGVTYIVEHERGWPLRALWCFYRGAERSSSSSWEGGLRFREPSALTGEHLWTSGALPCKPIWPGLLLNTALYAGAWWGLLFGPALLRRRRRARRGACLLCGYDLRGLGAGVSCPECGGAGRSAADR